MKFLTKLAGILAEDAKLYFKPLTIVGARIWRFWRDFWGPVATAGDSKIDIWLERRQIVRFVNKYVWIFLGAVAFFVVAINILVFTGVVPSGINHDNLKDYICAGLFLSWTIVEWVLNEIRCLFGSADIASQVRYGGFLILLGFIMLFAKEILFGAKKLLALIVGLPKKIKNFFKR